MMRVRSVLIVGALIAAACGGAPQLASDPLQALTMASEGIVARGPLDVNFQSETESDGSSFTLTYKGVMDVGAGHASFTMTTEGPGDAPGSAPCRLLFDDTRLYVELPEAGRQELSEGLGLTPETRWIHADFGGETQGLSGTTQVDDFVEYAQGVEVLGQDNIKGVSTTRYGANLSLEAFAELSLVRENVTAKILEQQGFEAPRLEAWIDSDGLLRRLVIHSRGTDVRMNTQWDLAPHEDPLDFSLPPAETVSEVEDPTTAEGICFGSILPPGTESGEDRTAQSSVRNAITAAKTLYADTGSYEGVTAQQLNRVEPSVDFVSGPSTGPQTVSVAATSPTEFRATVLSESGTCFGVRDVTHPVPERGTAFASGAVETCTATAFPASAYSPYGWS